MRAFFAGIFIVLAAPTARAVDADTDRAKAAAVALLAAAKAKDLDGVMKAVDVPFVLDFGREEAQTFDNTVKLQAAFTKLMDQVDPDHVPTVVETVFDMPALAEQAKERGAEKQYAAMEKLVGKTGYMVRVQSKDGKDTSGMLIRIKDGKAFVAALTK